MSIRALKNHVNVALNRPCGASSESNNHPARFANGGAIDTSWYADEPLARWWVDLEGFYQLANVKLRFAAEGNMRYLVETSDDYDQWRVVVDRRLTDSTRAERNELCPPGTIARYVRVKFVHVPFGWRANLCELEVYGILSVR